MIIQIFFYLLIAGAWSYKEIKKMLKEKLIKEIVVFIFMFSFSSVLFVLKLTEIHMINPLEGIKALFEPIGLVIHKLFSNGGQTQ